MISGEHGGVGRWSYRVLLTVVERWKTMAVVCWFDEEVGETQG